MSQFKYKATTVQGKMQKGIMEAGSREDLLEKLKQNNLFCVSTEILEETAGKEKSKLKHGDLVQFCRQLSTMLQAGITVVRALDIMHSTASKKKVRRTLLELYEGVQKGQVLSYSMSQLGGMFPDLLIHMIETGETSGTLDQIMMQMSTHYEKELRINNKVKTAMIYPIVLSVVSLISVTFMVVVVLPRFVDMFKGNALPLSTRILLAISGIVTNYWWAILLVILLSALAWTVLMTIIPFKTKVHQIRLRLPIVGKLLSTIYTSRFASTFSILYASGITILQCIEITARVLGNLYVQDRLLEVSDGIKRGEMLSTGLAGAAVFDPTFTSMVLVGEESGALDDILSKTGNYFEGEADNAISKMVALIEPMMILILAVIIGFIVISIILPIFTMYTQII